jgi:putative ABC transport system substrate-binding protein
MMRRRDFITFLGGAAAAWPVAARAQQPARMRRVGVLESNAEDEPVVRERLAQFRQGLEMLGWREGRNVRFDNRYAAANPARYQALAKELVALQPDVILAMSTPVTAALQRESRVIPIVFTLVSDPIGSGFIKSLARPSGNLTGLLAYEEGIVGKWLVMLKEITPDLRRAALVGNPSNTPYDYFLRAAQFVAPSLAIELVPMRVAIANDIERAIEKFSRESNGGLVMLPSAAITLNRDLIFMLAARYRLPAVYSARNFVEAGGLMSYAPVVDQYRQAAFYVDRILRGAKPADLPVQAPAKYETVLNLKTARDLGLAVPDLLLVRADEVIE